VTKEGVFYRIFYAQIAIYYAHLYMPRSFKCDVGSGYRILRVDEIIGCSLPASEILLKSAVRYNALIIVLYALCLINWVPVQL